MAELKVAEPRVERRKVLKIGAGAIGVIAAAAAGAAVALGGKANEEVPEVTPEWKEPEDYKEKYSLQDYLGRKVWVLDELEVLENSVYLRDMPALNGSGTKKHLGGVLRYTIVVKGQDVTTRPEENTIILDPNRDLLADNGWALIPNKGFMNIWAILAETHGRRPDVVYGTVQRDGPFGFKLVTDEGREIPLGTRLESK